MVGAHNAAGIEILADFAEDIFIARFLEIGRDHGFGIFAGLGARNAHLFRRPQPEKLVAPGHNLEAQGLVMGPFGFFRLATVLECLGHLLTS